MQPEGRRGGVARSGEVPILRTLPAFGGVSRYSFRGGVYVSRRVLGCTRVLVFVCVFACVWPLFICLPLVFSLANLPPGARARSWAFPLACFRGRGFSMSHYVSLPNLARKGSRYNFLR